MTLATPVAVLIGMRLTTPKSGGILGVGSESGAALPVVASMMPRVRINFVRCILADLVSCFGFGYCRLIEFVQVDGNAQEVKCRK